LWKIAEYLRFYKNLDIIIIEENVLIYILCAYMEIFFYNLIKKIIRKGLSHTKALISYRAAFFSVS